MNSILNLMSNKLFRIEIFEEIMILNEPIEVIYYNKYFYLFKKIKIWPVVDCLMCFYSDGFPLMKAIQYVEMRKPFCINDVNK